MPKTPVDEAPAGPHLDAAVAEAMGLCPHDLEKTIHWSEDGCGGVCHECKRCHEKFWGLTYTEGYHVLPYSTDIAAAWEVHKAACAMLFSKRRVYFKAIQEQTRLEGGSLVAWPDVLVTLVDTFPEAVCRAFLKARGVTHVEIPGDDG